MKQNLRTLAALVLLMLICTALLSGCAGEEPEHPQLIAHAGGGIYGYRLTNSREALDQAYDNGFRYVELDFDITSDGHVVLIHGWHSLVPRLLGREGQLTLEEFQEGQTFMDLSLLSLEELLQWLKKHPDVSVITDVKTEDYLPVLEQIARQAGDRIDRFIPQIYEFDHYDRARELGYERIILTLYRMNVDEATLNEYVSSHELWAVTMAESRVSAELLGAVTSAGTAVYAHSVNDLSFFEHWHEQGLTGIYTDYFQPEHWPEME